jgi:hypothetical protein
MTVEGNVIEYGVNTPENVAVGKFRGPVELFWKNNRAISGNNTVKEILSGSHTLVEKRPVWPAGLVTEDVEKVKERVLANAGARPWERDEIDLRIIREVMEKTSKIIHSEKEVGGYPVAAPVYRKFIADQWNLDLMIPK